MISRVVVKDCSWNIYDGSFYYKFNRKSNFILYF